MWAVCVSVCAIHAEARVQLNCHSSGASPRFFWDRVSHCPLTHQFGWGGGWPVGLIDHLSLLPQCWLRLQVHACFVCLFVCLFKCELWGIDLRSLGLQGKHWTIWAMAREYLFVWMGRCSISPPVPKVLVYGLALCWCMCASAPVPLPAGNCLWMWTTVMLLTNLVLILITSKNQSKTEEQVGTYFLRKDLEGIILVPTHILHCPSVTRRQASSVGPEYPPSCGASI